MSGSESMTITSTTAMMATVTSLLSIPSTSFPLGSAICHYPRDSATLPARISSTVRTACGNA